MNPAKYGLGILILVAFVVVATFISKTSDVSSVPNVPSSSKWMVGEDAVAWSLYETGIGFKSGQVNTKIFFDAAESGDVSWALFNGGMDLWG